MQTGGKRGGRGVVVKDRTVIQGDAPWEASGELGAPQHQLIGLQRRIGGIEAGIALDRYQRLTTCRMLIRQTLPTPATCMRPMPHRVPTRHAGHLGSSCLAALDTWLSFRVLAEREPPIVPPPTRSVTRSCWSAIRHYQLRLSVRLYETFAHSGNDLSRQSKAECYET